VTKLREAAAAWLDAGRWVATVDILKDQLRRLDEAPAEERERLGTALIDRSCLLLSEYERAMAATRARADALTSAIEHPGAVLARRLLATFYAGRAAWRGSR